VKATRLVQGRTFRGITPAVGFALLLVTGLLATAPILSIAAPPAKLKPGEKPADATAGGMKRYDSKYYVLFTDLGEDGAKETSLRMTRMAEEYYNRTKDFSGKITKKFPFHLFSKPEDYYAAGGVPGSAGVFMYRGDDAKLMAIAIDFEGGTTWHVVQHEGFHQFAHAVIGGERPPWVNEGLAEYFGESIWTGDGFVTGVLDPQRLKRVQDGIKQKRFKSFPVMMTMTGQAWNSGLSGNNYDQAWSMTHFLAHGEGGRYQKAFSQYMNLLGRGVNSNKAWLDTFGDATGFQERWEKWTLDQPLDATAGLYAEAKLATLSSFLARAAAQKQGFDTAEEFTKKAEAGELKASRDEWLPPSLLKRALAMKLKNVEKVELDNKSTPKTPRLAFKLTDGTKLIGNFKLAGQKVSSVWVEHDDTDKVIANARKLLDDGKKEAAKEMLQAALRKNPKSARAEEIRAMVAEAKK
jgi:hypothetical protein